MGAQREKRHSVQQDKDGTSAGLREISETRRESRKSEMKSESWPRFPEGQEEGDEGYSRSACTCLASYNKGKLLPHYKAGNDVDHFFFLLENCMEVIIGMRTLAQWKTQEACAKLDDNDSCDPQIVQPDF